jgi:hypothetical protein
VNVGRICVGKSKNEHSQGKKNRYKCIFFNWGGVGDDGFLKRVLGEFMLVRVRINTLARKKNIDLPL